MVDAGRRRIGKITKSTRELLIHRSARTTAEPPTSWAADGPLADGERSCQVVDIAAMFLPYPG